MAKQIDGLGGEWTYDIFLARATMFHVLSQAPEIYEPIDTFDGLALEAMLQRHFTVRGLLVHEQGGLSVAIEAYSSIFDAVGGRVPMPADGDRFLGFHSVRVISLEDENTLVFRHGWSGWADRNGVGYLTREYVDAHAVRMNVSRPSNRGPLAETADDLLKGAVDDADWLALWRAKRPHGYQADSHRKGYAFEWYSTWSLVYECDAEVIVLTRKVANRRLRVATAIVHHEAEGVTTVIDLFVWPTYRHEGNGSAILSFTAARARSAGSRRLDLYIWDSDCIVGEAPALAFVASQGFAITSSDPEAQARFVVSREI